MRLFVIQQKAYRFVLNFINSSFDKLLRLVPHQRLNILNAPTKLVEQRQQIANHLSQVFKSYTPTCVTCFSVNEHCCYSTDGVFSFADTMFNRVPLQKGWNAQNSFSYAIKKSFGFLFAGTCGEHNGKICEYLTDKGCGLSPALKPMGCLVSICPKLERVLSPEDMKQLNHGLNAYVWLTIKSYGYLFSALALPKVFHRRMYATD